MGSNYLFQNEFADKRQLNNHLASKSTHGGRLSVVGMWRFSYEKKFGRVNGLRTPVEEKYSMEYTRLEKDFFTEGNAYWMAIYPEDYRRIHNVVTKVTKKGSRLAVEAGNLVTDWASKCHSIRRTHGCLLVRAIPGMRKLGAHKSSVASNI